MPTRPTPPTKNDEAEDANEAKAKRPQRLLRGLSVVAIVIAAITGTAGVGYAALYWSLDELITPHGWIVVGCTTTMALGVFLGATGFQRARDREIQAAADRQRHADADRIAAELGQLLPSGRVSAQLEQIHYQVALTERRAAERTRIMRQMLERFKAVEDQIFERTPQIIDHFDQQIAVDRARLDSVEKSITAAVKQAYADAYVDAMSGEGGRVRRLPNQSGRPAPHDQSS